MAQSSPLAADTVAGPAHEFLYVPRAYLDALWPRLEGFIAAGLEHGQGEYAAVDLYEAAQGGRAQLWAALSAPRRCVLGAAATQVIDYPRLRVLQVVSLAGDDFAGWIGLADAAAAAYARHEGCHALRVQGRAGWVRRLADYGYREHYRQVDRSLT